MNEIRKALNLTEKQMEALQHRLDLTDALAEVMAEEGVSTMENAEHCAELLRVGKLAEARVYSVKLTNAILIDAVEGSTWVGVNEDEGGEAQGTRAYNVLCKVGEKVAAYTGAELVRVPKC